MKSLEVLGKFISKRPALAVALVILITVLSIFSVAYNGINSEFNTENFMPDNEVSNANMEIQEKFSTTYGVTVLGRSYSGDLITQQGFLKMLEAEQRVLSDQELLQYLSSPQQPMNSVVSPVDIISMAMLQSMNSTTLSMINATQVPTYDNLIKVVQATPTPQLKQSVYGILQSEFTPEYVKTYVPRLFTNGFNSSSPQPVAEGILILYNFNKSAVGSEISQAQLETQVKERINQGSSEELVIYVMGNSLINQEINQAASESMEILFPLAAIAIVLILLMVYRDLLDMVVGLVALVIAISWIYGFGTAMGYSFNPMTTVVPILIMGLGIDYSIHLVLRYREERANGETVEKGVTNTAVSVGEALALATITTAIAFLSNLNSPLQPIMEFGILSAVGIVSSFIVMMLFIPAVKAIRDRRREERGKENDYSARKDREDSIMGKINLQGGKAAISKPGAVILVALVVTAGFGIGAMNLNTEFNFTDFLPEDLELSENLNFMMENFTRSGESSAQILVKGQAADPEVIRAVESSISNMADDPAVLGRNDNPDVSSYLSLMLDYATNSSGIGYTDTRYNETFSTMYHQSFNVTDQVPSIKEDATRENITTLIGWLYVNAPGDITQVLVPSQGLQSQLTSSTDYAILLQVSVASDLNSDQIWSLYNDLKQDVGPLGLAGASAVVTGDTIVGEVISKSMNESQITSLITTLIASVLVLTLVMWHYRRSYVLGGLATIPIAFCVVWMWGTMFLMGIPLNVMTLTIAALTVGMGVTYGIHITHRFVEEIDRHGEIDTAVRRSVGRTGVSLFGAAITTVIGFGIIGFSILPPVQQFGIITALAIGYSFIASVFVLPAVLVIWAKRSGRASDKESADLS